MRHPRLNLGLIGFSATQHAHLQSRLQINATELAFSMQNEDTVSLFNRPSWQITDFREANALLLNMQHAQWDDAQMLHFRSHPEHPHMVGVRLAELAVPYAVCGLQSAQMDAAVPTKVRRVQIDDDRSLVQALQYFERRLQPLRSVYTLAHHLIQRHRELDANHTFHLIRNGTLDAIVDVPRRRVAVRDGLRPIDLDDASWQPRPISAGSPPNEFSVWMIEEVEWLYAMHCKQFTLPARYLSRPLYFRRLPRVRAAMLYTRHNRLLELLAKEVWTYERLVSIFAESDEQLQRDLYGLYLCRAITTSPEKAKPSPEAAPSSPRFLSGLEQDSDFASELGLKTAPAGLQ
jgi:hypothetical protein